ncbi:MAG: hypothetical protein Q8O94_03610 [bacterium]|nr:hypothetical protein [bacterium]
MGGKASRSKGQVGERELRDIINATLGTEIGRELSQVRDGGADLILGDYYIECKRQETLHIGDWCHQAEKAAEGRGKPVVAYRRSREPWRIVLRIEDFLELLKERCPLCSSRNTSQGVVEAHVDPDGTEHPMVPCMRCKDCDARFE